MQLFLRVPFSFQHYAGAIFGGGDVIERINVEQHEVGSLSFLDRADLVDRSEKH